MSDFFLKNGEPIRSPEMPKPESPALSFFKDLLAEKDTFNIAKHQDAFVRFFEKMKEKNPSSAEYNEMIRYFEPTVLRRISLLEDVSILLRGDCLNEEEVDTRFENKYMGAIHNTRALLSNEKEKYVALALFMKNIFDRCVIAWNYEKKQKDLAVSGRKALILFGLDENSVSENDGGKTFDMLSYFDGQGDDIGSLWSSATALELPSQGLLEMFPAVLKQELDKENEVLNFVKIYQETEEDVARMKRIIPDTETALIPENIFSRPESYFHLLVLCYIILKEVAESL